MTHHCLKCAQDMIKQNVLDIIMINGNDHVMEFESNQCKVCKKHIMSPDQYDQFIETIMEMKNGKDEARL